MSLADIITNAVSVAKTVTEGIQISITHRACSGWSSGVRTYGASTTYSVLLEHREKLVRAEDGKEHLSTARVYFLEPLNVGMEDEITLPDGMKPQILAVDGLFVDEQHGDLVELVAVLGEDAAGRIVGLVHHAPDLGVDLLRRLVRILLAHAVVTADERLRRIVAEGERAEVLAHAVLRDHAPRRLGGALQIV